MLEMILHSLKNCVKILLTLDLICVCGFFQDVIRKEWMFKLVGREVFQVGKAKANCVITIEAVSGFAYEYTLEVNGKSLKKFSENQSKIMKCWYIPFGGEMARIVLGKTDDCYLLICNKHA